MLYDFERAQGQQIAGVFYPTDYQNWRGMLIRHAPLSLPVIWSEVDGLFATKAVDHQPLITVSWVPGADWTGTPYQPIYSAISTRFAPDIAVEYSAKFLGLLFMDVAIARPEKWGFGHYELAGKPIKGRTYFLLH
jgi:hypothetical protein